MNGKNIINGKQISNDIKIASSVAQKVWPMYKKIIIPLNCVLIFLFATLLIASCIVFWIAGDDFLQHALKKGLNVKQYLSDPNHLFGIQNWTNRNFVAIILADICAIIGVITVISMANEFILAYVNKSKFSFKKIIFYSIIAFFILMISIFIIVLFNTSSIPIAYTMDNGFKLSGDGNNTLSLITINPSTSIKWVDLFPSTNLNNVDSTIILKPNEIQIGNFKIIIGFTAALGLLINLAYIFTYAIKYILKKKVNSQ